MPNVVTHGLMALDVYNQLEYSRVKSAIKAFPKAYLLGSNGPDFLFYYQAMPWQNKEMNQRVADHGHVVHQKNINEFYNTGLEFILNVKDEHRQSILISFMAGHLQHWALDSLAHPFVFYRSGPLEGKRPYDHYRYESMIDALMVTYVKRRRLQDLKAKRFLDVNEEERRVIASFYQRLLDKVFDIKEDTQVIEDAMKTFKKSLTYLYDPNNIVFNLVSRCEKRFGTPWKYSSHIVSSKIDAKYDVLNLKHETWSNPTNINEVSTQSFVDIYNQSIDLGLDTLIHLEDVLDGKETKFDRVIQDRNYETGRSEDEKMEVFDSIYLKK